MRQKIAYQAGSAGKRFSIVLAASFAFGIPVRGFAWLNWSLWPTLTDLVWIVGFVFFAFRSRRSSLPPYSGKSFRFAVIGTIWFLFVNSMVSAIQLQASGAPASQFGYSVFTAFRILQGLSIVWLIQRVVYREDVEIGTKVLVVSASLCAAACVFQLLGLLDYRVLVSHLNVGNAGPWTFRFTELPDAALGTWNFNRINTAHFLAVGLAVALCSRKISALGVLASVLLTAGILATQSRSVVTVVAMFVIGFAVLKRRRDIAIALVALSVSAAVGYQVYERVYVTESAEIALRQETVTESIDGRFAIQTYALEWWLMQPFLTQAFGVGFGNTGYFVFETGFMPAHGQFVTLLVEAGFLGALAFLIMGLLFILSLPKETDLQKVVKALAIAYFCGGFFNDILLPSPTFLNQTALLATLIGWSYASSSPARSLHTH